MQLTNFAGWAVLGGFSIAGVLPVETGRLRENSPQGPRPERLVQQDPGRQNDGGAALELFSDQVETTMPSTASS
jgi:hypothetical protein